MTKRAKKTIYKAFIASASDCDELRKAALCAISEVNKIISAQNIVIEPYAWEECKKAEFIKSGDTYQDKIFKEFGNHCDIFIIFFWTKLGEGTKEEYEHFKNTFSKYNNNILFLGCHYNKPISHSVLEQHKTYYDLLDFISANDKDWAPLGKTRRAIKNKMEFARELRCELLMFLPNN